MDAAAAGAEVRGAATAGGAIVGAEDDQAAGEGSRGGPYAYYRQYTRLQATQTPAQQAHDAH